MTRCTSADPSRTFEGRRAYRARRCSVDYVETTLTIYRNLTEASRNPAPRLRLWDGSTHGSEGAPSTLVLQHPGAMRSLVLPPTDLTAGEAYVYDDIDIEGDIFHALAFAAGLEGVSVLSGGTRAAMAAALRLPRKLRRHDRRRPVVRGRLHTPRRDRRAVTYHYETGNDFFGTFLGPTMVYSCAYFLDPDEDLDTAQTRKLDLVARKLALSPGDRLLDVGCGWGSMAIHAARRYGVRATGITLSESQAELARARADEAGVSDRVEFLVRDYREVEGEFDAISSIGMVEHVGRQRLDEYFRSLRTLLAPGGRLLNHGIVDRSGTSPGQRRRGFVNTYVFPDGDLVPVPVVLDAAEEAGFEIRDVEALRVSYALTLRRWVAHLESNHDRAVAASSERTYRIWRLYMAGSAIAFERGAIGVYQSLLVDPRRPWTYGRARLLASDDVASPRPAASTIDLRNRTSVSSG
jgi:cyclopropane-fatty-acyl-phospholipid synthase